MTSPSCATEPRVQSGLDRISRGEHDWLRGRRVGLVTSASAVTSTVTPAVEVLRPLCTPCALFAPEHGITAHAADGAHLSSSTDRHTGLPLYSLYGETVKPTAQMLKGIDLLVLDIQDVGARFYTYIWTMSYVLEAAAEHRVPLVVLDRPNPIGGHICEGPVLEPRHASFVGRGAIPVRHGLTMGELARLFNNEPVVSEHPPGADLAVVEVQGWRRSMWFDQTGLPWVPPSPAMAKLDTAIVYPGMCLLEGTNLSVGRGTATPFECIGAPWIDGHRLASVLNELSLPGVRFRPVFFTPWASSYQGETCEGIFAHVMNRETYRPVQTGLHVVSCIRTLWPSEFRWLKTSHEASLPHFDLLIGNGWVREQIDLGQPVEEIADRWQDGLHRFTTLHSQYALYE